MLRSTIAVTALLAGTGVMPLSAQNVSRPGEAEFRWSGDVRSGDLVRAANIAGDVSVTTTEGGRVELIARRRGSSSDELARVEVKQHANGITICALHDDDAYCDDSGPESEGGWRGRRDRDSRAHYDFEVRVPRRMRVNASSVSGDVAVTGTATELRATSVSGDVTVERARAARTLELTSVSGDVRARLDAVESGTDLEFRSVSGDVSVSLPRSTGFDLSMSTVSGDLESDFPLEMRGRFSRRRIQAKVNDGGSELSVSTVSGDVRLAHNQSN